MNKTCNSNIVTRFAPSPTGYLHLGGARTALLNWMYSKKYSGKFLLRIENTDQSRSNPEMELAIFEGLNWLGLEWDDTVIYQLDRQTRHLEVANFLLEKNLAYKCFSTKEEIEAYKVTAKNMGESTKFISPWRDQQSAYPSGDYVVRLKVPNAGQTVIKDSVQGKVSWDNGNLDDLVLIRSNGTATYNLAVVVDDFDFNITHIIRGDDHLTNAARQLIIYKALNWNAPIFAHIPLIHGSDGKKLSKRHGAVGLEHYQRTGIKASAMVKYLSQLGWDSGKNDLSTAEDIIQNFMIEKIVKSPAKFDPVKLDDICSKHIRNSDDDLILTEFENFLKFSQLTPLKLSQKKILTASLHFLKPRIKNFLELYDQAQFLIADNKIVIDQNCSEFITKKSLTILKELAARIAELEWGKAPLNDAMKLLAKEQQVNFKEIAQMVRIALVGKLNSPGIFDMILVLGKPEVIRRINDLSDRDR